MTTRRPDDDRIPSEVPAPDEPINDLERARASSFAERVDALIAGETQPPAMAPDERALIELAGALRAGAVGGELSPDRTARAIDGAFAALAASSGADSSHTAPSETAGDAARRATATDVAEAPRRHVVRRAAPWLAAAVAAAAAFLIATSGSAPRPETAQALPERASSRPADALIGAIPQELAGDARSRADTIFADRLRGYRDIRLSDAPGGAR